MSLLDKIDNINKPVVKKMVEGDYTSLDDFWNKTIVPNLPSDETIRAYHKLLVKYIKSNNATLAMRAHHNEANGHINLRRGWFNRINDSNGQIEFFFTDNFFAHYFTKMATDNYVPDYNEFVDAMKSRKFPFRFAFKLCKEEFEKLSFRQGKNPGITSGKGYYLAHILGTGTEYHVNNLVLSEKDIEKTYFPCGSRDDYILETDKFGDYFIRDLGKTHDEIYRKLLVACFIRFTHPINNFISPNKKSCIHSFANKSGIGESLELLYYSHDYFLKKFPNEYKEFLDLALAPKSYYSPMFKNTGPVSIHCELNCAGKKSADLNPVMKSSSAAKSIPSPKTKNISKTISHKTLSQASLSGKDKIMAKIDVTFKTRNKLLELFVNILKYLISKGKLTQSDMDMLTSEKSKDVFAINFIAVVDANSSYPLKRYGQKTRFTFNGKNYLVTNDWYPSDKSFQKIADWAKSKGL